MMRQHRNPNYADTPLGGAMVMLLPEVQPGSTYTCRGMIYTQRQRLILIPMLLTTQLRNTAELARCHCIYDSGRPSASPCSYLSQRKHTIASSALCASLAVYAARRRAHQASVNVDVWIHLDRRYLHIHSCSQVKSVVVYSYIKGYHITIDTCTCTYYYIMSHYTISLSYIIIMIHCLTIHCIISQRRPFVLPRAQRLQNPSIKEYTLNHFRNPNII